MKSRKSFYAPVIFCVIALFFAACKTDFNFVSETIKGNGTLITKEISIEDYDKIEIVGRVDLNYQQLEENPYFQFTIDENLVEYLDIHVKNRILYIEPVKNETGLSTYNLNPTKFIVNTNSKQIRNIDLAGSGTINLVSDIQSDNLDFDIAGSGKIVSEKSITIGILTIDLAGSGNIALKGNVETCKIDIAGSGNMISPDLSVKHLKCDIAGSGKVEIDVTESIHCDIAGSGTIIYTGNPSSVNQDIAGSGKLIKK